MTPFPVWVGLLTVLLTLSSDGSVAGAEDHADPSGGLHFSRTGGTFVEPFTLTLTAETPGAVIRYTTKGPTLGRSVRSYLHPIVIRDTTRIVAQVHEPNKAPGPIVEQSYIKLDPDLENFSSNLPLVLIETFGQEIDASDYQQGYAVFIEPDPNTGRTSITDRSHFAGRCGLKIRGSTSATEYPKKQYAFETWNTDNEDMQVSLFGLPSESDWILYGPYDDGTLMRNVLAYHWSNQIGRYAARTCLVETFLNTGSGSMRWGDGTEINQTDYVGAYVFMEKIKRDKNRIDIAKVDLSQADAPDSFILKADRIDPGDVGFHTSRGTPIGCCGAAFNYVYPKERDMSGVQRQAIIDYLEAFEDVLYGPDYQDAQIGYAAYIDVNAFIDHHILNEFTKNSDGLWLSAFLSKEAGGKLSFGPVWDMNFSLGGDDGWDGWDPRGWHGDAIGSYYWWWPRLFTCPDFRQKWSDRWFELRQGALSTQALMTDIDATVDLLWESQQRNFVRWPQVLGEYVWRNARGWHQRYTFQMEVDYMKTWLTTRLAWLDERHPLPRGGARHPAAPQYSPAPGEVRADTLVTLTAPQGTIYYTTDGTDPRRPMVQQVPNSEIDDSVLSDSALAYTEPISLIQSTRFRSRVLSDTGWSPLHQATYAVGAVAQSLRITEIMYHPLEAESEFIELKNAGPSTINLNWVAFTDGIYFTFPPIDMAPGDTGLLVRSRQDFTTAHPTVLPTQIFGQYAGTLSNAGERIVLQDALGRSIHDFHYQDDWYDSTDGDGLSLTVRGAAAVDANDLSHKADWRPSTSIGGSPGTDDTQL